MRSVLYVLSFLALISVGSWAYRVNYSTQDTLREVAILQADIARLRENLGIQRAEWAFLNRPERLRELATLNFDRLGLLPMESVQFGTVAEVAYPPPPVAADLVPNDILIIDPADSAASDTYVFAQE